MNQETVLQMVILDCTDCAVGTVALRHGGHGVQVICHRNDRKKQKRQNDESDVSARYPDGGRRKSTRQRSMGLQHRRGEKQQNCQQPNDIEQKFHCVKDTTTRYPSTMKHSLEMRGAISLNTWRFFQLR